MEIFALDRPHIEPLLAAFLSVRVGAMRGADERVARTAFHRSVACGRFAHQKVAMLAAIFVDDVHRNAVSARLELGRQASRYAMRARRHIQPKARSPKVWRSPPQYE